MVTKSVHRKTDKWTPGKVLKTTSVVVPARIGDSGTTFICDDTHTHTRTHIQTYCKIVIVIQSLSSPLFFFSLLATSVFAQFFLNGLLCSIKCVHNLHLEGTRFTFTPTKDSQDELYCRVHRVLMKTLCHCCLQLQSFGPHSPKRVMIRVTQLTTHSVRALTKKSWQSNKTLKNS